MSASPLKPAPSTGQELREVPLSGLLECSATIRGLGQGARSMEEVAQRIVAYLYQYFTDAVTRDQQCALVRFYKTLRYEQLPAELRDRSEALLGSGSTARDLACFTLLATAGSEPAWNDRRRSIGHKTVPLLSPQSVRGIPMVAQLFDQLGLGVERLVSPNPELFIELAQQSYNWESVHPGAAEFCHSLQDQVGARLRRCPS